MYENKYFFYILDDQVTIFFGISFEEGTDKSIAKLILYVIFFKIINKFKILGTWRSKKTSEKCPICNKNAWR